MAGKLFGGKAVLVSSPATETEPEVRYREPDADELALGWAHGIDMETDKNIFQLKGMKQKHRKAHFYIIGASGTGKTRFLEYLI